MFKYIKKYKSKYCFVFFLSFISSTFFSFSLLSQMFLYDYAIAGSLDNVLLWVGLILTSIIFLVIFNVISEWFNIKYYEQILLDIKFEIINKINYLKFVDINENKIDIASMLSNDINMLEQNLFAVIPNIVASILLSLMTSSLIFYFSWILGLVAIGFFTFNLLLVFLFSKYTKRSGDKFNKKQEEYSLQTKNSLEGITTLFFANKIQLLSKVILSKFNKDIAKANVTYKKEMSFKTQLVSFVSRTFDTLIILISAILLINKKDVVGYNNISTIGSILALTCLSNNLFNSASSLSTNFLSYFSIKPIVKKISDINLQEDSREEFNENKIKFNLNDLSYKVEDKLIFDKFKLEITPNNKYALIGSSGKGKSTLAKLLCGLIKPNSGFVLVNDKNLLDYKTSSILNKIGYVEANPYIIADTVKNNITLYDNNFDKEKYEKVLSLLSLKEIDNNLIIDEVENDLSVGQKQRINLARYLYKDYKYLIFDEALSNLDYKTANVIENSLLKNKDLTFINITHHLDETNKSKYNKVIKL